MEDILDYARKRVDNKAVMQRIGHSAKLHKYRSAFVKKGGSLGSKAAGIGGLVVRTALKQISIPVVGGFLAQIEQTVEDAIRSEYHKFRRDTAPDARTEAKFELKELSVSEMDRYRWKVEESLKSLNQAAGNFPTNFQKKQAEGKQCDAYLEFAMAYAQAERRVKKLEKSCAGLEAAVQITHAWLNEVKNGKDGTGRTEGLGYMESQFKKLVKDDIDEEVQKANTVSGTNGVNAGADGILDHHGNCDEWCCFRDAGKPDDLATLRKRAAQVTRFLLNNYGESDLAGDVVSSVKYTANKLKQQSN